MEKPGAEQVFRIVQDIDRSSQVTLEAFQHQLQFISNLQQQTLEDVSVVHSDIADILNHSIAEIERFRRNLFTAQMTSTVKGNEIDEINHTGDKQQLTYRTEEEDCVENILLHEAIELSMTVTAQHMGIMDLIGSSSSSSSDSGQTFDTQQNRHVQYTKADNYTLNESVVAFEGEKFNLGAFSKRHTYAQHMNRPKEAGFESLAISNHTFNENVPLSSTMRVFESEDNVQEGPLHITDLIPCSDHIHVNPACKESEPKLEGAARDKNTSRKTNGDKLFEGMSETIAGSKTVNVELESLSEPDQVEIPDQLESKPLQKALGQLHSNAQSLRCENLQFRNQINRLKTDRTLLHIRLYKAEKDAEAYHQQAKAMTDKCEELLKERKQSQDERNHLSFEKHLMKKEIELLKEETKTLLKDLSSTITEKDELIKKLNSLKKMALSYAREKQDIYYKWNKILLENDHLRRKADDHRTQLLKRTQDNL